MFAGAGREKGMLTMELVRRADHGGVNARVRDGPSVGAERRDPAIGLSVALGPAGVAAGEHERHVTRELARSPRMTMGDPSASQYHEAQPLHVFTVA